MHVWDIEKASTIRTVFGPHVCGNAVDVVGSTILTGSWRDDSQVNNANKTTRLRAQQDDDCVRNAETCRAV